MAHRGLTNAASLIAPAVEATVSALSDHLDDRDSGAVRLARSYAAAIDDARNGPDLHRILADLGPKLLVVLEALGASPRARAAAGKGAAPAEVAGSAALWQLRAGAS